MMSLADDSAAARCAPFPFADTWSQSLMSLSKKQIVFIDALRTVTTTSPVSRQDLLVAANTLGQKFPPAWIVKDAGRHAGRGKFHVPELGDKSSSVRPTVAAPVSSVPVMDQKIQTVTTTAAAAVDGAMNFSATVMGMTGGERSTLVPPVSPEYVAWGHYTDIEKIMKTKLFAPIFVTGLSGNGKTTMIEQICAKNGRECFRVNIVAETDEDDLLGGFRLINGNTVWQDGPVVEAMQRGAVLLLDEIDLGTEKIMCLQSVLEGKGVYLKKINKWVTPALGFTVLATANTKGKGSDDGRFVGTRVLNEAFLDRFDYTYEQEYAPRVTEKKILQKVMKKFGSEDNDFADNLTKWSEAIRKTFAEGGCDEIISTRRLINICKAFAVFGDKGKAIRMSLARFDMATQEAFFSSYTKIDAAAIAAAAAPAPTPAPAEVSNGAQCPF